jgi:hypothetical protein
MKTKPLKIDCAIPSIANSGNLPFHLLLFLSLKELIKENPNPPTNTEVENSLKKLQKSITPKWLDWVNLIKQVSYFQDVVIGKHRLRWTSADDLRIIEVNDKGLSQDELERFF